MDEINLNHTLTSAADAFAAAVCELAQYGAATPGDVLSWINRAPYHTVGAARAPWLQQCGSRHITWGALQLRRAGCTNFDVNMRILQRLTAHVREVIDILKADVWTTRAQAIAAMWIGDASPWVTGRPLLDASGNGHVRSLALFRRAPTSLHLQLVQDHGDTNLWWAEDEIAAMLRDPAAPALPRFVGDRSWCSNVPTVIGRINVSESTAGDPDAVRRLCRRWRMRATTACRSKRIAAYIPPYMPEVVEVFS